VVDINGVDTEACCGTHCDNTAEVGWVRIVKTSRISDGIVRLTYVANERAIEVLNEERDMIQNLCEQWKIGKGDILKTANKFFKDYKKLNELTSQQDQKILNLQLKFMLKDEHNLYFVKTEQPSPTIYFSFLPQYAEDLKQKGKGIIFIGHDFLFGLLGNPQSLDLAALENCTKSHSKKELKVLKKDQVKFDFKVKGKKPVVTQGIC